jgi:hypothetical protein
MTSRTALWVDRGHTLCLIAVDDPDRNDDGRPVARIALVEGNSSMVVLEEFDVLECRP